MGSLSNDDAEGNGNGNEHRKNKYVKISKTTTLHVHHVSFTFFSRRCKTATWIVPGFTPPLYKVGEHKPKTFFFFF